MLEEQESNISQIHGTEEQTKQQIEECCSDDIEITDEQRIEQLEAELSESKDQFLRVCADMENQRRRAIEDVKNAHKYAINKFAKELLSVRDSLEMALLDQSTQFDNLKMGVELTLKQLATSFENEHILQINPIGEKLDPHLHHAIGSEASSEPANTIIKVLQKGYLISDRVLRPAMVIVAKTED